MLFKKSHQLIFRCCHGAVLKATTQPLKALGRYAEAIQGFGTFLRSGFGQTIDGPERGARMAGCTIGDRDQ